MGGWTAQDAADAARHIQALEAGAARAKELRPYLQRYIELRGPVALAAQPEEELAGGTWALAGGKVKTVWTEGVLAIEATLLAAGRDPAPYLPTRIDTAAVAEADALTAVLAAAYPPGGFRRFRPNILDLAPRPISHRLLESLQHLGILARQVLHCVDV